MEETAEQILGSMIRVEREAAELMRHAHKIMAEEKTDGRNVVTEYDRAVQELLMRRLRETVPGAAFFCEENGAQDATDAGHVFIIDPIDGTMNFVRHLNNSCISCAYMYDGELQAAAVYNPYVNEMFTARKGGGAFLNGAPIHASPAPLRETVFCFGSSPYYAEHTDESFRLARIAFDNSLDLRRFASAELDLCSVAAGRAGMYFELCLSLWDYAAGMLIVSEAGGRCTAMDGAALPLDGRRSSVLAGGVQAYEDFRKLCGERAEAH